ncbi:hypothetical protein [Streptomyces sp. AC558_RSS880]|jgi:hypothetical protein|uniref:hypothetical protein n=1 Tax=Streptomyces sp. AC558_RSS880 TaxID=2823687 RepID=UPI001C2127FA|nr:hypothetical protein [Streptomyces sp. AC558_RSS880]
MRFAWFVWLTRHIDEFGFSHGPVKGAIGTAAVLLTAVLLGFALRRHRPADLAVGGVTAVAGIGWLAFH